jgi:hypothetical protein
MHKFIQALDTIRKNWYLELEMHMETTRWEELVWRFGVTFTFKHESPSIHRELHEIQTNILSEVEIIEVVSLCNFYKFMMTIKKILECYSVTKEEYEDEDPRNFKIPDT